MSSKKNRKINRKRLFFYATPLLLMVGVIIGLSFVPPTTPSPTPTGVTPTAVSDQPPPDRTPTRAPILLATILPSPTPTITPRPAILPDATITLLGPPDESSFYLHDPITFYWQYSEPLLPGQELVLILSQNDAMVATYPLAQPNLGTGFQVSVPLEELLVPGTAVWQVHLQWADEGRSLLTSADRRMRILSE